MKLDVAGEGENNRRMTGTLQFLLVAVVTFVGGHFVLASLPVRQAIIGTLGDRGFRILFSVFALATLVWTIRAYIAAPYVELWPQTVPLRHVPALVMPFACILLVAGSSTRSVTAVGGERLRPEDARTRGILTITRHPTMWGIALWALAHIAPNGDAASLLLFGGFALLAFGGMLHIDYRRQQTMGSGWGPMALTTSLVPFLAAAQGRTRIDWKGIGLARVAGAVALYAALVASHEWLFGVSPLPVPVG